MNPELVIRGALWGFGGMASARRWMNAGRLGQTARGALFATYGDNSADWIGLRLWA